MAKLSTQCGGLRVWMHSDIPRIYLTFAWIRQADPLFILEDAQHQLAQQCLIAFEKLEIISDHLFHTLLGFHRAEWRGLLDDHLTNGDGLLPRAWWVIVAFNNIRGYPHRRDAELLVELGCSQAQLDALFDTVFDQWSGSRLRRKSEIKGTYWVEFDHNGTSDQYNIWHPNSRYANADHLMAFGQQFRAVHPNFCFYGINYFDLAMQARLLKELDAFVPQRSVLLRHLRSYFRATLRTGRGVWVLGV